MKLLMISGDRSILQGKMGAFWYTLQELRKHWDRIDIICPRVPEGSVDMVESGHRLKGSGEQGGEVFFHPCPHSLLFQIPWIIHKGTHLIRSEHHDVMTVHEYPPFYNGIGAKRLHKKTGIPYALEVHHVVGWPEAANLVEWIGRQMSRRYLARSAKCACSVRTVNSTVKSLLTQWGIPASKIQTISSFYLDRSILSQDHKPPVAYDVAFCARLVPNKGLTPLLKAIAGIPEARLLVVGDGPEKQNAIKLVDKLGIENRVTFLGWLPTQEAVSGAMQTARMFVMNSSSEGGPRTALEAMACGLPVITTEVGVMPEVIEDGVNGIFTDGSVKDLVKKIGMLMRNEQKRIELGKRAQGILDQFERSALIEQYAEFLKHAR